MDVLCRWFNWSWGPDREGGVAEVSAWNRSPRYGGVAAGRARLEGDRGSYGISATSGLLLEPAGAVTAEPDWALYLV